VLVKISLLYLIIKKLIVMKLSKLEKKVLFELRDKISNVYQRERIEDFDSFNEEDVEYRLGNIEATIKLLQEEKSALKMLTID